MKLTNTGVSFKKFLLAFSCFSLPGPSQSSVSTASCPGFSDLASPSDSAASWMPSSLPKKKIKKIQYWHISIVSFKQSSYNIQTTAYMAKWKHMHIYKQKENEKNIRHVNIREFPLTQRSPEYPVLPVPCRENLGKQCLLHMLRKQNHNLDLIL